MTVSYIDFVEERLELGYDYGCVGGPQFKTDIVVNGAENEQRNLNWWFPLGKWQLGERMLLDSDIEGIKEVEYLRSFHAARSGSKQGFRFKDWADYQVVGVELGTGDGITTQWQLKKLYTAGIEQFYRAITKPVEGTVRIYLDGNEITYHLINHETGLISFAAPVNSGVVITADFEFDVPVSFEKDDIEWTLEAVRLETGETLHRLGSVMVEEMRIDLPIEWYHRDPIPYVITEPLNLGIILDVSESIQLSTESQSLSSGFKSKISTSEQTKVLIKLPSVAFTQEQLDKILAYFWVARGRLIDFLLQLNNQLRQVRFDSDSLSIKFSASSDEEQLFEVNNLVYLGILEEQNNEQYFDELILDLPGNDYTDDSIYSHPVTVNGAVPIVNTAYSFSGNVNNYLSINYHPAFDLADKGFDISFDLKVNQATTHNILSTRDALSDGFSIVLLTNQAIRFSYRSLNGAIVNSDFNIPNNNYLNSTQNFKISSRKSGNIFTREFYYNNVSINNNTANSLATGTVVTNPTTTLKIGRTNGTQSPLNGIISNIKIRKEL